MKERFLSGSKQLYAFLLAGIGMAAVLYLSHTGHGIPCMFRLITGWKCPGCGMTTLLLSLLRGNLKAAFSANPFLFCTLPVLILEYVWLSWAPDKMRKRFLFQKALPTAYLVALLLFGILRNVTY